MSYVARPTPQTGPDASVISAVDVWAAVGSSVDAERVQAVVAIDTNNVANKERVEVERIGAVL
jgi:hypothetical protein